MVEQRTSVLAVINGLGTGGAERSLAESVLPLRRRGIEVRVACFHRRTEGVHDEVERSGAAIDVIDRVTWSGRIDALRTLIERHRPDVVHTTLFEADVVGRLAARRNGPPVLCSLVNTSYARQRLADPNVSRAKLAVARTVDGFTARRYGTRFHAITGTVRAAAIDALGLQPDLVTVVPRGRRRDRLGEITPLRRAAARAALGVPDDRPVLLNIGRHEYQKAQLDLIEAAAQLRRLHPDLVVLIAGREGNATADLTRRIAELGLAETVRLLGHTEVAQPLAAADLFVFPSRYEGLGGAVLEAMALEVPVVASDIDVLHEVLDDTARFAPVDDPRSLAATIGDAMADPADSRHRAARARRRFDEHFEFERVMDRMAELYDRTARHSDRPVRHRIDEVLVKTPLPAASQALTRNRVTVLAYHGISDRQAFAEQLDHIAEQRTFIGPDDLRAALDGAPLPERATLLTFDDGRRSVLEQATPEITERGLAAVLFVVTDVIGTTDPFWWDEAEYLGGPTLVAELKRMPDADRRARLDDLRARDRVRLRVPQLEEAEIRGLAAQGFEIGNHTASHPCLDQCAIDVVRSELEAAHHRLDDVLGSAPRAFAYPNGNFDPRAEELLINMGYDLGFLFDHRSIDPTDTHRLRISRLRMNERISAERLEMILSGLHPALHGIRTRVARRRLEA